MKNLQVRLSQDNPREGISLNEWYKYIHDHVNKRLNVTRNMNDDSKELIVS